LPRSAACGGSENSETLAVIMRKENFGDRRGRA
jgi:hypothetical protein